MSLRTLASASAVASMAGVAVLGLSAPASAQAYPPADTPPSVSDSTVVLGQMFTLNSGNGFCPLPTADLTVFGGTRQADVDAVGNASETLAVPAGTQPGRQTATFACAGDTVDVSFTVVAAAAANPGQGQRPSRSGLPLTGADQIVPLTITGVALVGIGAGIVIASRRRRETDMPAGLA